MRDSDGCPRFASAVGGGQPELEHLIGDSLEAKNGSGLFPASLLQSVSRLAYSSRKTTARKSAPHGYVAQSRRPASADGLGKL